MIHIKNLTPNPSPEQGEGSKKLDAFCSPPYWGGAGGGAKKRKVLEMEEFLHKTMMKQTTN
jgi:hypothetical protein